jgi:hypothetical protein
VKKLNPFSSQHVLYETINLIDKSHKRYKKILEVFNESIGQKTYTELLMKVLEGDKQEPIIHFGAPLVEDASKTQSLLPDSEFPVPQAEPEHPDYIGINRTMNFNPESQQRSVLEVFETNELKKDFKDAFPWACDSDTINKLNLAKVNPTLNLLATDRLLSPSLQMAVMSYVLLSLDCLGKISGYKGELAIQNFSSIKMISDALQEISNLLLVSSNDDDMLTTKIDHMTYKLVILNQDLVDMLSQTNPPMAVQNNLNMNDFCHINEYLTHKLLGISFQKSILTPINSNSPILDKVNASIKHDLLRGISLVPTPKQAVQDDPSINTSTEN